MRGDLLVHTFVEIPKKVNAQQEELLRKLASLEDEHVTPHRKSFVDRVLQYFRTEETDDKE
jgi:molecular chaperone DnaJ